jgi:hypothetical protein
MGVGELAASRPMPVSRRIIPLCYTIIATAIMHASRLNARHRAVWFSEAAAEAEAPHLSSCGAGRP